MRIMKMRKKKETELFGQNFHDIHSNRFLTFEEDTCLNSINEVQALSRWGTGPPCQYLQMDSGGD